MKIGGPNHPKVRRLARKLGIPHAQAVGHYEMLQHFAAEYAPTGSLAAYDADDIAEACSWEGDSDGFVRALVACELLDEMPSQEPVASQVIATDVVWAVHDWADHAPDFVHAKVARRMETFADGTIPTYDPSRISSSRRAEISKHYEGLRSEAEASSTGASGLPGASHLGTTARHGTSHHNTTPPPTTARARAGATGRPPGSDPPAPTADDVRAAAAIVDELVEHVREVDPDSVWAAQVASPGARDAAARDVLDLARAGVKPAVVGKRLRWLRDHEGEDGCGYRVGNALELASKWDGIGHAMRKYAKSASKHQGKHARAGKRGDFKGGVQRV